VPFPQAWADKLFEKLRAFYGAEWDRMYAGQHLPDVKAAWCDALSPWSESADVIRFALANLPEKPPNAIAFRNLCRSAPQAAAALQILPPRVGPQKVAEIVASARIGTPADPLRSPAQSVIDGIIQILTKKTEAPSRAQRQFVERCVTMLPANDQRRVKLKLLGFTGIEQPAEPAPAPAPAQEVEACAR
jgi:hypothetical protein